MPREEAGSLAYQVTSHCRVRAVYCVCTQPTRRAGYGLADAHFDSNYEFNYLRAELFDHFNFEALDAQNCFKSELRQLLNLADSIKALGRRFPDNYSVTITGHE